MIAGSFQLNVSSKNSVKQKQDEEIQLNIFGREKGLENRNRTLPK